ncbi:MAG: hypothetical protein JOZ57_04160, partial [Abitibacteriaceae bacterium]|nr:hypothetical protein [Abditibacteriaceae bacterium]
MTVIVGASWLFLVWFLGWLSLPLARRIWGDEAKLPHAAFPDAGLAAGRMLLLVIWTLLALWCGHAGVPVRWCVFLILLPGALCVWLGIRDWPILQATVRERRRGIIASELVFLLFFAGFFIHRGFWPDFNNGEKPMDLALIGACARADYLPPPNPYAANVRLDSYYYLGHLQAALLTDAIHSTARWTYNLMCGTLPALCFSLAVSLCGAVTRRVRNGVIGGCLLLATGTLEPLRQWFKPLPGVEAKTWPIDYMATSRVIPFTINEYPWFTFSYGDVHAHYFDMPVSLLVISLGWVLFWRIREGWDTRGWKVIAALCGTVLSANLMTNTWDFPTYTLFIFLCLSALVFYPGWKTTLRRDKQRATDAAPSEVVPEKTKTSKQHKKSKASGVKSATQKQAKGKARSQSEVAAPVKPSHSQVSPSHFGLRLGMALGAMLGVAMISLLIGWPFLHHLHTAADKPRYLAQPASPPRSWLLMWALPMGAWIMNLAGATKRRLAAGQADGRIVTAAIVIPEALWLLLKLLTNNDYFVIIFLVTLTLWTAYEAFFSEDVVQVWLCRLALCGFLALCWSETTYAGF